MAGPQNEQAIPRLIRLLETRIPRRGLLEEDLREKQDHFRNVLVEMERENAFLRYDNVEQNKLISMLEGRVCKLQNNIDGLLYKLNDASDVMRNLQQELRDKDRQLEQYRLEKRKLVQRYNVKIQTETDRITREMQTKLQEQREQLTSYIKRKENKMRLVKQILTAREDTSDNVALSSPIASSSRIETAEKTNLTMLKEEPSVETSINLEASRWPRGQIRQALPCHATTVSNNTYEEIAETRNSSLAREKLSTVLIDSPTSGPRGQTCQTSSRAKTNSDNVLRKAAKEPILMAESSVPSDSKTEAEESKPIALVDSPSSMTASADTFVAKTKFNTKIPVVNPRYQRAQNVDRWIDHRPFGIVPTGTILQPRTQPHKRTIRKLTNPKHFVARSSRYSLLSQEQDTDGELETKLYKAEVLPTCGGGAQIVFNDIECLKQVSPTAVKNVTGR
ncbi:PREDICTED: kinesin-like protein KIF23 isoform X2 [Vollenhovia emeryi]|nr:PREDICTED: kinesin-like protein KIF23 isoform X2 [Vollenhovia emeryi]